MITLTVAGGEGTLFEPPMNIYQCRGVEMPYLKFTIADEARKVIANKPTVAHPAVLLYILAEDHLKQSK